MHVAIILDGNRRYAKSKHKSPWMGHRDGAKRVGDLLKWSKELGITELTLYTFSVENFNRAKKEVDELFKLFRSNLSKLKEDARTDKEPICVNFIGRLHLFPKDLQKDMQWLMKKTKNRNTLKVNFAIGYGGRSEIVDAVNTIIKKGIRKVTEASFAKHLTLDHDPDLIIRPGGEYRISNFLLWQGSYAEWYFTKKLWPEFTKKELQKALSDFKKRERRFGR